jgi:hypothetical protein
MGKKGRKINITARERSDRALEEATEFQGQEILRHSHQNFNRAANPRGVASAPLISSGGYGKTKVLQTIFSETSKHDRSILACLTPGTPGALNTKANILHNDKALPRRFERLCFVAKSLVLLRTASCSRVSSKNGHVLQHPPQIPDRPCSKLARFAHLRVALTPGIDLLFKTTRHVLQKLPVPGPKVQLSWVR